MNVDSVIDRVRGVPHMSPSRGRELTSFLLNQRPSRILELGTSHGVSTCYMAAAAEEYGGHVTTIDRKGIDNLDPNVWTMLTDLGLSDFAEVIVANRSFTWELMRMMQTQPNRRFDFCFIDGGHTWDVTGYSFFLVDRLLESGSWILFDDLDWSYSKSPSLRNSPQAKRLSEEEFTAKQVGLVFDLLVGRHDGYGQLERDGNWGWARKAGHIERMDVGDDPDL
jgi:predicted O-methyltransferase YrrM